MPHNSFKYVNYHDLKKFSSDFKVVYNVPNEEATLSRLDGLKEKWGRKYPYAISSWGNNWEDVNSFFQFSDDMRRIMYTTYTGKKLCRHFHESNNHQTSRHAGRHALLTSCLPSDTKMHESWSIFPFFPFLCYTLFEDISTLQSTAW